MLFGLDKLLTMVIIVINKNHLHQNAHKEYKNIVIVKTTKNQRVVVMILVLHKIMLIVKINQKH
jgi:hypothetical protein